MTSWQIPPDGEQPERVIAGETGLQKNLGYENRIFADRCETHMLMDGRHTNRHNSLHGGIHAILLDSACGMAASRSSSPDASQLVVTLSLNTNYLAAPQHEHIYAVAKVSRAGRSVVYADGQVFDGAGNLLATGSSVLKKIRQAT
ncbi:MAG: PaaI family thioesterase [Rhizobiaceae bacterium]|nr:PaaI family thioesterase [Hyphomicrobiales bacterium]NRB31816.1 PaaI family thioesterase [Rhizobiaceae bacterium]